MTNHVAQTKPEPAANQVWMFDGDNEQGAPPCGPCVIRAVGAIDAMFTDDAGAGLDWMRSLPAWRCVGVETPAGRVMVGEWRSQPGVLAPRRAVRVDGEWMWMGWGGHGDDVGGCYPAALVASWPLLPPLAQGTGGTENKAGSGAALATAHPEYGYDIEPYLNPPPDPCAAREQRRREIDRVLTEDRRRHPAFATARRCAVLAWCEMKPRDGYADDAKGILTKCRVYEGMRGGMTKPAMVAVDYAHARMVPESIAAYERARCL